jgi:microcystin-dependent protein
MYYPINQITTHITNNPSISSYLNKLVKKISNNINMNKTNKYLLLLLAVGALSQVANGQVKVGNNPTTINNSAVMEVESTTKGFLPPRMTQIQMNAIVSPARGLIVYCSNCSPVDYYTFNGRTWTNVYPRRSVITPITSNGALYQDTTNSITETVIMSNTAIPLNDINVIAILTTTPTTANASGLYIQTAGTLPALTSGSATIALNDVYYWNASTSSAWRKYAYANCPNTLGVGSPVSLVISKFSNSWFLTGGFASQSIGMISAFGGTIAPEGNLLCDGASYLRTQYPDLFAVIGTSYGSASSTHFNVPDLRGRFLRGVDGTANIDPDKNSRTALRTGGNTGNNVGSVQADAFKSHTHTADLYFQDASLPQQQFRASFAGTYRGAFPTNPTGGNETRPTNVNVNYIIKAVGASNNVNGASFSGTTSSSFTATANTKYPINTTSASVTVT